MLNRCWSKQKTRERVIKADSFGRSQRSGAEDFAIATMCMARTFIVYTELSHLRNRSFKRQIRSHVSSSREVKRCRRPESINCQNSHSHVEEEGDGIQTCSKPAAASEDLSRSDTSPGEVPDDSNQVLAPILRIDDVFPNAGYAPVAKGLGSHPELVSNALEYC